jgi:hypothetical protein
MGAGAEGGGGGGGCFVKRLLSENILVTVQPLSGFGAESVWIHAQKDEP